MRAAFGLDACRLLPQRVLAGIPLIGGVQVCRCMACTDSQEGRGSGWLLVMGPSAAAAVGHRPLGKIALDLGTLGGGGGSCGLSEVGAVVSARLQGHQQWWRTMHTPGEVGPRSWDPWQWAK